MKKVLFAILSLHLLLSNIALAGGGITHMFVAAESINKIPDQALRTLLQNNMDAYLVGAYYPDSGYAKGLHYGEDSHWDPFIYTFADYLNDKDVLILIDKYQWFTYPREWWIPVSDLVEVYRRMGKPQYTANEIIHGSKTIAVAGFEERAIAAPTYPALRWWKMPWTAAHYYDYPRGGLVNAEDEAVKYQMKLWDHLLSKAKQRSLTAKSSLKLNPGKILDFGKDALETGAIIVTVHENADGSVNMDTPVVKNEKKVRELIEKVLAWLR